MIASPLTGCFFMVIVDRLADESPVGKRFHCRRPSTPATAVPNKRHFTKESYFSSVVRIPTIIQFCSLIEAYEIQTQSVLYSS